MSESAIKFTYAPDGEIQTRDGHTVYSNLFMLGAIALTSQNKITKTGVQYDFATDTKGLEKLINVSNEALDFIQGAIVALGLVMTDSESEEIEENKNELNWLVIGLTELSTMISKNLLEMNRALNLLKEVEAKNRNCSEEMQ